MTRDEVRSAGEETTRMPFVLDAAVRIAAATECEEDASFGEKHEHRAEWAFDAAEALWTEACKRFPEQEEG